jgi:hypothetical protein
MKQEKSSSSDAYGLLKLPLIKSSSALLLKKKDYQEDSLKVIIAKIWKDLTE